MKWQGQPSKVAEWWSQVSEHRPSNTSPMTTPRHRLFMSMATCQHVPVCQEQESPSWALGERIILQPPLWKCKPKPEPKLCPFCTCRSATEFTQVPVAKAVKNSLKNQTLYLSIENWFSADDIDPVSSWKEALTRTCICKQYFSASRSILDYSSALCSRMWICYKLLGWGYKYYVLLFNTTHFYFRLHTYTHTCSFLACKQSSRDSPCLSLSAGADAWFTCQCPTATCGFFAYYNRLSSFYKKERNSPDTYFERERHICYHKEYKKTLLHFRHINWISIKTFSSPDIGNCSQEGYWLLCTNALVLALTILSACFTNHANTFSKSPSVVCHLHKHYTFTILNSHSITFIWFPP